MSPGRTTTNTAPVHAFAHEVLVPMPEAYIVIFLLFFAVLAFAWFYTQRAKARTDTTVDSAADPTPAEHADHSH
jgi:hypothetical protein